MQQRCKGDHNPRYEGIALLPRSEFIEWALNDTTYIRLFEEWHAAGCPYRLTPSIDRIDCTGGYVIGNIRFLTHSENARGGSERYWRERKAAEAGCSTATSTSEPTEAQSASEEFVETKALTVNQGTCATL
jgi:hypothetical protein